MLSRSLDIIALIHLAVAINGQIYDAEIHSDEIGRSYRLAIAIVFEPGLDAGYSLSPT
jgi:hypothetical protein